MKNNLQEINSTLEDELEFAEGLSELLLLIETGIPGFERNGITFQSASSAFGLITNISKKHVENLDAILNELVGFANTE